MRCGCLPHRVGGVLRDDFLPFGFLRYGTTRLELSGYHPASVRRRYYFSP